MRVGAARRSASRKPAGARRAKRRGCARPPPAALPQPGALKRRAPLLPSSAACLLAGVRVAIQLLERGGGEVGGGAENDGEGSYRCKWGPIACILEGGEGGQRLGAAVTRWGIAGAEREGGKADLLKPSKSKDPFLGFDLPFLHVAFPNNSPVRSVGLKTAPPLGLPLAFLHLLKEDSVGSRAAATHTHTHILHNSCQFRISSCIGLLFSAEEKMGLANLFF